jgi:hypothetical protein
MKAVSCRFAFVLVMLFSNSVQAELIDRGGGLIYDTELNVTWLQDANFAKTSGYHEDGRMTWEEAMKFVENLKYFDPVRKVTWDDWRLPTAKNRDGSGPDRGYYTRGSELGHMYYNNLGNQGLYAEDKESPKGEDARKKRVGIFSGEDGAPLKGQPPGQRGVPKKPQAEYGPKNRGPFINLMEAEYWTGTEDLQFSPKTDPRYPSNAWDFFMDTGTQFTCDKWDHWYFAWPVRDGDVGAPPAAAGKSF